MCQSTAENSHSYILTRNCVLLTERHDRHGFVQLFQLVSHASPYLCCILLHNAKVEAGGETIFQPVFLLDYFMSIQRDFALHARQARPQIGPPQPQVALTGISLKVCICTYDAGRRGG